jgi:hypothetical protein
VSGESVSLLRIRPDASPCPHRVKRDRDQAEGSSGHVGCPLDRDQILRCGGISRSANMRHERGRQLRRPLFAGLSKIELEGLPKQSILKPWP